jgi:hypothetical protein
LGCFLVIQLDYYVYPFLPWWYCKCLDGLNFAYLLLRL